MTNSASPQSSGFWDTEILDMLFPSQPQPLQDTDLLRQLPFVPGLKEVLMLRQVHALEHATVWVLGDRNPQMDNGSLGGMSTDRGFYLYGSVELAELRRAVQIALQRITAGEWNLAVHPRCGTNLSVGVMLTTGLALGASLLLPRGPIEQAIGVGIAAMTAASLTPDLGSLAQRYITTAVPFNLAIAAITATQDPLGRPAHFVQVRWID